MNHFEPKIIAFLCNWCSGDGADLASNSRIQSIPNVSVVRVMCSSRIDPTFIMKVFSLGADGVFIGGCHFGDCHYVDGNYKTYRRISLLKKMMRQLGIEEERLWPHWVSAAEPGRLIPIINAMTEQIRKMGPLSCNSRDGRG